ncbi:NADH dehydrogenase [ubiquinone] 1 beta subcomplex subunit 7 [Drosophila eugracilis]|uniref:NADH dehydrogenase [ubiquinone] 1 beta subcomplex subunit 7 n=1 Tax=Drosophila eugracilis TaxID=29029 RepID=UPI0007E5CA68|nr:NADH dehydrogenase [ubiquinone] 1 beta subcomplex subunit 7 [Drosophila eugracilis]XP_017074485.1 NADH dehydrogenase [ubiquinone] 1 beta subcomplex subunit 7 [Drosophila eugracilis]
MGNALTHYLKPDVMPGPDVVTTFDPMLGFETRKERVMIATQEEMESAKLPLDARDYCAHLAIAYQACRTDTFPFVYKCAHQKHEYLTCEYEDYVLRMKEFERERRLLERQKRLNKAA